MRNARLAVLLIGLTAFSTAIANTPTIRLFPTTVVEDLKQTGDFIAGLPVEVFIDSGITRSPMSYIIQPLSDIFRNALRSE